MAEENKIVTEVEVIVRTRDIKTGEMKEALCAVSKFSKGEIKLAKEETQEEYIYISIKPGTSANYADAVITINNDCKKTITRE